MQPGDFSARVKLPCRVFFGPEAAYEYRATALAIDTGRVVLAMPRGAGEPSPEIEQPVQVELTLPQKGDIDGARCLTVRARVAQVREMEDGSRRITVRFRKAVFGKPSARVVNISQGRHAGRIAEAEIKAKGA